MKNSSIIILCIVGGIIGLIITTVSIVFLVRVINTKKCDPNDPNEPVDYKPVIYLYPEKETDITVKLGYKDKLLVSYPKYIDGWSVTAYPDGTLIDKDTGRKLYSLYWEGKHTEPVVLDEGFIVRGEDSIEFLEEKLAILGLNDKEIEEFIIYWLPKLQENKCNYIRFADIDEINKNMPLEFSKEPDTIIRVLMQYKALNKPIKVKEQKLNTPNRVGFVVVEWGGSIIK